MESYRPLDAWLSGQIYLKSPFHMQFETYSAKEAWIAFDVAVPLHEAPLVELSTFQQAWSETYSYLERACGLLNLLQPGRISEVQGELVRSQFGEPPIASIGIYMMSVAKNDGSEERCVYVGKTNASTHRFRSGHAAMTKLHAPKYDGLKKTLYLGSLAFEDDDDQTFWVEWTHPAERRSVLMNVVEETLINSLQPELNEKSISSSHLAGKLVVRVQNTASKLLDAQSFGNDGLITSDCEFHAPELDE
jgi:hypothetical protein